MSHFSKSIITLAMIGFFCISGFSANTKPTPQPIRDTVTLPVQSNIAGSVELVAAIDTYGVPSSILVTSSTDQRLNQSAIDALSQWRFIPAFEGGRKKVGLYTHSFIFSGTGQSSGGIKRFSRSNNKEKSKKKARRSKSQIAKDSAPLSSTPVLVKSVPPKLSPEIANIHGSTTVLLLVDHHGDVADASIVDTTHIELIDPSLDALRKWKFTASPNEGELRKVQIPVNFKGAPRLVAKDHILDNNSLEHANQSIPVRQPMEALPASVRSYDESVVVSYIVDAYGHVADADISQGTDPSLIKAALKSVYKWKHIPATSNGEPIPVRVSKKFYIQDKELHAHNETPEVLPQVVHSESPELNKKLSDVEGHVIVSLALDDEGNVLNARVAESTNNKLNKASIEASYKWKFNPGYTNDHPVPSHISIPFIYPNSNS